MTIGSQYTPQQSQGNGVTINFAIPWPFFAPGDITVNLFDTSADGNVAPQPVLNGGNTYDYQVIGNNFNPETGEYVSGTVEFNNAPLGNHRVTIGRGTAETQNTSFTDFGPFPAKALEAALDRLTIEVQEIKAALALCLQAPVSDIAPTLTMPPALVRALGTLTLDSLGNLIVTNGSTGPSNVVEYNTIRVVAANGNAGLADAIIEVNAGAGPVTLTVPLTLGTAGQSQLFKVVKTDATANPVTISDGSNAVDVIVTPMGAHGQVGGWRFVYSNGTTLRSFGIG